MSNYADPCPPELLPPDPQMVLPTPENPFVWSPPTSYTTVACVPYSAYSGWLLLENGAGFVLQEDGASLIAI